MDQHPSVSFGDTIHKKAPGARRFFPQNVKGLTFSTGLEDYHYYVLQVITALQIDIAGLLETNTAWQHPHLQADFRKQLRKYYRQSKVHFGFPVVEIDKCAENSTYQPGESLTLVNENLTSSCFGDNHGDPTGLGRWSGITLRGKGNFNMTIITAYRTCGGNIRTYSLGSTYSREYNFFRDNRHKTPNPRRLFLQYLETKIKHLQYQGHAILLMLDANADDSDPHFQDKIHSCALHDLHEHHPAPSTYIGSNTHRIDYIFGCCHAKEALNRSGTLAYTEGPQSDRRGLFVDLQIPALQGYLIVPPLSTANNRYLHTGNQALVDSYISNIKKYYEEHRMLARLEDLHKSQDTMNRDKIQAKLISWDLDQGRAMSMAKHRLRKPPKKFAWSPALRNAAIIRRYWKLRLWEVNGNFNFCPHSHDGNNKSVHMHRVLSCRI
jgi:hypothetical protein